MKKFKFWNNYNSPTIINLLFEVEIKYLRHLSMFSSRLYWEVQCDIVRLNNYHSWLHE